MFKLLTKILWLRRSKWQFLFAGIAFALGLAIMLSALEAYLHVAQILNRQKEKGQFLLVNKKITMVNTLGLASSVFSTEEMEALSAAPFTMQMGQLESNQFQATIKAKDYIKFSSVVFFESVPDAFLDEPNPEFRWREGQQKVPIIVSQDFLNLYNFGYAISQNLPQVSRDAIKMVPFDVTIVGPGGTETYEGQIVGFSERIASVLIPQSFMHWANREIAQVKPGQPSRLILQVESIANPAIANFLEKNRMSTDQEKLQLGKTGNMLQTIMKMASVLGLIFLSLAFVLFTTNFRLILAEAAADIQLLIELGYRHASIRKNLLFFFSLFLSVMLLIALAGLLQINPFVLQLLQGQGLGINNHSFPYTGILTGLAFTIAVIFLNGILILRQLKNMA